MYFFPFYCHKYPTKDKPPARPKVPLQPLDVEIFLERWYQFAEDRFIYNPLTNGVTLQHPPVLTLPQPALNLPEPELVTLPIPRTTSLQLPFLPHNAKTIPIPSHIKKDIWDAYLPEVQDLLDHDDWAEPTYHEEVDAVRISAIQYLSRKWRNNPITGPQLSTYCRQRGINIYKAIHWIWDEAIRTDTPRSNYRALSEGLPRDVQIYIGDNWPLLDEEWKLELFSTYSNY